MDAVLRAVALYLFLFLVLRLAGRRTVAELTPFDLVLLLIISESTQQALLGNDFSIVNAFLLISTLIVLDIGLSLIKRQFPRVTPYLDGLPMVIVENGRALPERMRLARVDVSDVLQSARESQGLETLEQIKYAVLEVNGHISIIPKR
ncbi:MAG: DUF421 domain-containing protein [Kiloniellales bacterium]